MAKLLAHVLANIPQVERLLVGGTMRMEQHENRHNLIVEHATGTVTMALPWLL